MNLFDLIFPHVATASHLRGIRDQAGTGIANAELDSLRNTMTMQALKTRIDELENDLGFVVLALMSLLSSLDENGTVSSEDVARELRELDLIDGNADGKLNVRLLKHFLRKPSGE